MISKWVLLANSAEVHFRFIHREKEDAATSAICCSEDKRGKGRGFYTMSGVKGRTRLVYYMFKILTSGT